VQIAVTSRSESRLGCQQEQNWRLKKGRAVFQRLLRSGGGRYEPENSLWRGSRGRLPSGSTFAVGVALLGAMLAHRDNRKDLTLPVLERLEPKFAASQELAVCLGRLAFPQSHLRLVLVAAFGMDRKRGCTSLVVSTKGDCSE
jgi:hypothetical protein